MTPSRLDEIAARLAKATPGPWRKQIAGIEGDSYIAGTGPWYRERGDMKDARAELDADLIAHAPDDLAYLLKRLKAAEAVCKAAKQYQYEQKSPIKDIVMLQHRQVELFLALTTWQEART